MTWNDCSEKAFDDAALEDLVSLAVEKHPCGIRATHPQPRVIGISALVSRTQVGDNAGCEQ